MTFLSVKFSEAIGETKKEIQTEIFLLFENFGKQKEERENVGFLFYINNLGKK